MRKSWKLMIACMAIVIAMACPSSGVSWASQSKSELQKENQELESQVAAIEKDVEKLDKQLTKASDTYEKENDKLVQVTAKVKKTQQSLKTTQASKKKQYEIMSKRIKFLYENGETAYLEIIFEAKSLQEFFNRAEYVNKISKYDTDMFTNLKETESKIKQTAKKLKSEKAQVAATTKTAKEKKDKLETLATAKKNKVTEYQKKMAENNNLLAQYEQAEAAANSSDGSESYDNSSSGASKGTLLWPVPSCHSVSSPYGYRIHPVTGQKKLHAGMDIPCGTGSTIVASESGTVVEASYNSYNGNYIKIQHSNGLETMYLHCSKLLVSSGKSVKRGQTIAKSGATGMVSGAHLHFVVKKNGQYKNPSNYL